MIRPQEVPLAPRRPPGGQIREARASKVRGQKPEARVQSPRQARPEALVRHHS